MSRALLAVLLLVPLLGCARVKPWQRETLAHPALGMPPLAAAHAGRLQVLEIREGTSGAYGAGGGGCGCN